MKIRVTILFLVLFQVCFGQYDTVKIELRESSMSLKKCRGVLFNDYFGSTFHYPPTHKITTQDKLFIYNRDTVFFQVSKNKKLLIEGLKLPEIEAFDTISFYRNGNLVRQEVWVQQYFADSTGTTKKSSDNVIYASGDGATWVFKREFRKSKVNRILRKTIELDKEKGHCFKTYKKTGNKEKIIECKCY